MAIFQDSPEARYALLERLSLTEERILKFASLHTQAIADQVQREVVRPFCERLGLNFSTSMGDWCFRIAHAGPDEGRLWEVGFERRPKPGRPSGPEGDEDGWWVDITDEDLFIRKLLHGSMAGSESSIGSWMHDYQSKKEKP